MKVPLLDLTREYAKIETEITSAVTELLRSQQMILGPAVERFESELAEYTSAKFAVGCASGTDALLLALMALGIGRDDEVITTPFTFFSTVGSIWRSSAKPVFVDIDPSTFNLCPELVDEAITDNTRAIMPVHLYGQSVDMAPILEIADSRGITVVEDAAQAVGATHRGRQCGTMGRVGCLSFYPTKNLGAAGDAGALLTDDEELAVELRSLRVHGTVAGSAYLHRSVGLNSRLDAIQAVILSVKMKHLAEWNETRRRLAQRYTDGFARVPQVVTPIVGEGNEHIYHQYVIRVPRRDRLMAYLNEAGICARVFYPLPLHLQECFAALGYGEGDFPEAERAAKEVLALPIFPGLTNEEQDYLVEQVGCFFNAG